MFPSCSHCFTDFRTIFVFALGPFLPMVVIFFDYNGNFNGKTAKIKKWPKMTFWGPIWVPKVSFRGFWGLVCIEKWSQNIDSDTRSAISSTPKMAKMTPFWAFGGYQKWRFGCPNQNSETIQTSPQNPQKDTLGTQIGPQKVIFGHFAFFEYFYLIFPWARAIFFNFKSHHLKFISGLSNFFQVIYMYKHSEKN